MSNLDKLKKLTKIDSAELLSDSSLLSQEEIFCPTDIPILNIAFCGDIDGGLPRGGTMFSAKSKHFKTMFLLKCIEAFQKKHKDGDVVFYDSEGGTNSEYWSNFDIDTTRIIRIRIKTIEGLKSDIIGKMEAQSTGDIDNEILYVVDSIGNLPSNKELNDALESNTAADFTRAKQLKSMGRLINPYFNFLPNKVYLVIANHVYDTMETYSKVVVGGGQGMELLATNSYTITRRQNKNEKTKEIDGYDFILTVHKSRFVKENRKIPISVTYERNIHKYCGLLELALAHGSVIKPKMGWYTRPNVKDDKNYRAAQTETEEFWKPILEETDFKQFIKNTYQLGGNLPEAFEEKNDEAELELLNE